LSIVKIEAGDIGPEHIGTIAFGDIFNEDDGSTMFQAAGRSAAIHWVDDGVALVLEGVPESV
jgi:predicted protein tyrosine phosphatase